jgi:hypothetical protein
VRFCVAVNSMFSCSQHFSVWLKAVTLILLQRQEGRQIR